MSGRYVELAEKHLDPVIRGASEYMTACPFCGGDASLQFNIDSGLWICFRCDEKGNAKSLVRKLGGHYADPAVGIEKIQGMLDGLKNLKPHAEMPILPESYLLQFAVKDRYWKDRGYSKHTIKKFGLGYDTMMDRNTIPLRNEHAELLGVVYRLKGDVFPRYLYPKGFKKSQSLFNSWNCKGKGAVLVEGSTDAMALDDSIPAEWTITPLAQWGSALSMTQARLLNRLGVRQVVLFPDYDEAGMKSILRSVEMLAGFEIYNVQYDSTRYCWHKKLCDCGNHDWKTIGRCQQKRFCKCGRQHEVDPDTLKKGERIEMIATAERIGRKSWLEKNAHAK